MVGPLAEGRPERRDGRAYALVLAGRWRMAVVHRQLSRGKVGRRPDLAKPERDGAVLVARRRRAVAIGAGGGRSSGLLATDRGPRLRRMDGRRLPGRDADGPAVRRCRRGGGGL